MQPKISLEKVAAERGYDDVAELLVDLMDEYHNPSKIAKSLHCALQTVTNALRKAGWNSTGERQFTVWFEPGKPVETPLPTAPVAIVIEPPSLTGQRVLVVDFASHTAFEGRLLVGREVVLPRTPRCC